MNTARRGNAFDLRVTRNLEADGWLVASRRHTAGPGDLLAVRAGIIQLIECKTTARGPYEHFGPRDRAAMIEAEQQFRLGAWLAWRGPRQQICWIPSTEWP